MKTNPRWVGRRLRELRKARGWTRHQLAVIAGVSADVLRRIERRGAMPSWDVALMLCVALRVTPNDLAARPGSRVEH